MHEAAVKFLDQTAAVQPIMAAIAEKWPEATTLSADDLKARFPCRKLIAGWHLPARSIQSDSDLILALPELFPYELPIVSLAEQTASAELPHVERDGVICIASSGSLMELPVDIRHVDFVVKEAIDALSAALSGTNHSDFLEEASTYWTLDQPSSVPIWLASKNAHTSRLLSAVRLKDAIVAASDSKALHKWLSGARPSKANQSQIEAFYLALPSPLFPEAYPNDTGDLVALAKSAGEEAQILVASALEPGRSAFGVISFPHNDKEVLVGVRVDVGTRINGGRKGGIPILHGFRAGKIRLDILCQRISAARFPVIRTTVTRVDSDALLKRTTGPSSSALANMKVAVIGCGMLGGVVAQLLAQAGIRRMTLVDNDILSWQNVGRHILAGHYVGTNKAKAMQADLLSRLPDHEIEAIPQKWQEIWKEAPDLFNKHDLIVSVCAEWVNDALLNKLSKCSGEVPSVIFGWVEGLGLAGHAVAVLPEGGCLRCLTSPSGEFLHHVAEIPVAYTMQRETSCGSFYQPFSAAAAMPTAAMIVKTALDALAGRLCYSQHRVWVGSKDDFDAIDATIRPTWFDIFQTQEFERVYRRQLLAHMGCPVCEAQE